MTVNHRFKTFPRRVLRHGVLAVESGQYLRQYRPFLGRKLRRRLEQVDRRRPPAQPHPSHWPRSEEHTSELQSLMRISYAVFCLKKKNSSKQNKTHTQIHIELYLQRAI